MVTVGESEVVGWGGRAEEREYGDTVEKENRRVVIIVQSITHSINLWLSNSSVKLNWIL